MYAPERRGRRVGRGIGRSIRQRQRSPGDRGSFIQAPDCRVTSQRNLAQRSPGRPQSCAGKGGQPSHACVTGHEAPDIEPGRRKKKGYDSGHVGRGPPEDLPSERSARKGDQSFQTRPGGRHERKQLLWKPAPAGYTRPSRRRNQNWRAAFTPTKPELCRVQSTRHSSGARGRRMTACHSR